MRRPAPSPRRRRQNGLTLLEALLALSLLAAACATLLPVWRSARSAIEIRSTTSQSDLVRVVDGALPGITTSIVEENNEQRAAQEKGDPPRGLSDWARWFGVREIEVGGEWSGSPIRVQVLLRPPQIAAFDSFGGPNPVSDLTVDSGSVSAVTGLWLSFEHEDLALLRWLPFSRSKR